jgi:hypothetical protein
MFAFVMWTCALLQKDVVFLMLSSRLYLIHMHFYVFFAYRCDVKRGPRFLLNSLPVQYRWSQICFKLQRHLVY